jgi:hypothetical protein
MTTTFEPLDATTAAQIFGSGYRDGQRGENKRNLTPKFGEEAQEEYLRGYEQGQEDVKYESRRLYD